MALLSYRQPGLVLGVGLTRATELQVTDLQRDLRALGYLRKGIDGRFGDATRLAVAALQHDLLANFGESRGGDGQAPLRIAGFNRGRVASPTGEVDEALTACISELLDEPRFPKLPSSANPAAANRAALAGLRLLPSDRAPMTFILAILGQESGWKHFNEPVRGDQDAFLVVGLDTNAGEPFIVTSRGYGMGQYTLFHHPPRPEEVEGVMLDPAKNVQRAIDELCEKLEDFLIGPTPGTRADDRIAEIGAGPLRRCKYESRDPRFQVDCKNCLLRAGTREIRDGATPLHADTAETYAPTQYYREASYRGVPDRSKIGCDWPYAVRRYNGSGVNSYHYQARVLLRALEL
ncbi:MAG: peptidoglycan-binding domain-containing protein [Myxococcota bacterium]